MTTGCILRDDSITLSQQEYMHASGIYKKMIFFLQMTLSWEQGAWHPVYLYTKDTSMQFTFAPQVIVWYMSIYNQLFMLVVGASA
jgi:hypothetical protein